MRCERRWSWWVAVLAPALLVAACGGGDGGSPGDDASTEEPVVATSRPAPEKRSVDAGEAGGGGDAGDGGDGEQQPVADAPAVDLDVEELCERLAELDLDELFSEELTTASPGTGDADGCAWASEVVDGDIASDVEAMVTVARTASELEGDTVAGEAGGGLPDLERLPELGDQGAIRAFRTENEYVDTWEAWVFLALEEGLLRIQTRDPAWDDRDDAVDATLELLEELDVADA